MLKRAVWPAAILLAVGVLIGGVYLAMRTLALSTQHSEAEGEYAHSMEVLVGTSQALNAVYDSQRSVRGYLLTGREDFLSPYERRRPELSGRLNDLRELTALMPSERRQVEQFSRETATAAAHYSNMVELARNGEPAEAIRLARSGVAQNHTMRAVTAAEDLQNSVQIDLVKRRERLQRAAAEVAANARALAKVGLLLLLGALAAGWLSFRGRAMRRQRRAEAALGEAEAERDALGETLAAERAQLKTIVDTVPVGLFMTEFPSGRTLGANAYLEQILRQPLRVATDLNGCNDWLGVHADGRPVRAQEMPLARMMVDGEENPSIEFKHQRPDGSWAWIRLLGRPICDVGGRTAGGVVAVLDVTEEREAKEALEEAIKAKEMLLHEVNHRVKNSLQLVTSILAVEASRIHDLEARQSVLDARRKIGIIAQLHQRLYASGRHASVDFRDFLEEMAGGLLNSSGRDPDTRMTLEWKGDPSLSIRQAALLGLAVNELVTNSVKYALTEESGSLGIRGVRKNGHLELMVEDDGPGLPDGVRDAPSESIGLQIVSSLVKQMDGQLLSPPPGRGARFTIRVPIAA